MGMVKHVKFAVYILLTLDLFISCQGACDRLDYFQCDGSERCCPDGYMCVGSKGCLMKGRGIFGLAIGGIIVLIVTIAIIFNLIDFLVECRQKT